VCVFTLVRAGLAVTAKHSIATCHAISGRRDKPGLRLRQDWRGGGSARADSPKRQSWTHTAGECGRGRRSFVPPKKHLKNPRSFPAPQARVFLTRTAPFPQSGRTGASRCMALAVGEGGTNAVETTEERNGDERAAANRQSHAEFVRTVCETWGGMARSPSLTGTRSVGGETARPKDRSLAGWGWPGRPAVFLLGNVRARA
jgi:hypothetical protein